MNKALFIFLYVLMCIFTIIVDVSWGFEWGSEDTQTEVAWQIVNTLDVFQTLDIKDWSNSPWKSHEYELNPYLQSNWSDKSVKLYFLASAIIHPIVTLVLPNHLVIAGIDFEPRKNFQRVSLGISGGCVSKNLSVGINFSF